LDNTLTTYPTIAGDYTTVKPIYKNITLLKKLKSDGHEIIIYTARRMKTHHGNIGKVIKDIASITIDTLEKFNIEYDELIFGKPIADIYIDDRAINPYINDVSYFGLFYDKETDTDTNETIDTDQYIPNKIRNNKFNKIRRCDVSSVIKTGPVNILKGELYYYQNIPSGFEDYFPRLIDYTIDGETIHLKMDYIEGIPLYYLYKNCLLTHRHIDDLFDIMDRLHSHSLKEDTTTIIDCDNVKNNYVKKLKTRFNTQDYPFEDAEDVFHGIIEGIDTYFAPRISHVIHGDFWFSNIILDSKGSYKFLDMKGINDGILTLNGDIYYDYGKLYQSILGYDLVLNGDDNTHNAYIKDMKQYFLKKCCDKGLDIHFLTYVTKGLVFGTLPFISHYENDIKKNVWAFIKTIAYER
jgi:capsule biosynthesis phosphatase